MTLQWTLAAGFLYAEIGVILLFCVPFISPSRWNQIFKSRLISAVSSYGNFYFNVVVIVMMLLLADSVREMYKYNKVDDSSHMDLKNNPQAETLIHMKKFRAQRNFYISGFALFLLVVLRRVVKLLARLSVSEASAEASIKQAKAASDQCQRLMKENEQLEKKLKGDKDANTEEEASDEMNKLKKELEEKTEELSKKTEDLEKTKKDLTALKEQAEGVTREYDRLLDEHSKKQAQLEKSDEDKKDD
ncbi:B-cell receptor-associated protein 31 [Exaiptasia diaphana]|uniref:Endoplasmic reticulum transmembrane protein n=1 Tax=Exaiptasia diaphana TaxID=2652724 RepID=A0A913XFW5_EXADI|nr:B-cell receptor-associated protein 31 [Exaiptasia diaphana]KXJ12234.1 B-cell receptor-associated protein 31 [Exaiptasia diaphana]